MSLQDMTVEQLEVLETHLERQLANDRLASYEPYPKQQEWHNAGRITGKKLSSVAIRSARVPA